MGIASSFTAFSRFDDPSDYYLFSNLKRRLAGKKLHTNEEVEWETDFNFETFHKFHYLKDIERLLELWAKSVELDEDFIGE